MTIKKILEMKAKREDARLKAMAVLTDFLRMTSRKR